MNLSDDIVIAAFCLGLVTVFLLLLEQGRVYLVEHSVLALQPIFLHAEHLVGDKSGEDQDHEPRQNISDEANIVVGRL